jgi:hypothetical protein
MYAMKDQDDTEKRKTYMIVDSRVDDTDLDTVSVKLERVVDLLHAGKGMTATRRRRLFQ